jgi:3-dehydroquinate synthase
VIEFKLQHRSGGATRVQLGAGALSAVAASIPPSGGRALLADRQVAALHAQRLGELAEPRLELEAGEACKSFAQLERALEFLAVQGLERGGTVLSLGGGAALDLAGLAAALYMRGIALVHCPTSLLAMVDAAVGGKAAINLAAGKNLAGAFHHPRAVYMDSETLRSLPPAELASGLGEVVKTALIAGEPLYAQLEREAPALVRAEPAALEPVIEACVRLKARIVASDERDLGPRQVLNLGHTFAHALEREAGYGALPHGIAVAVGLVLALETSARMGVLREPELAPRTAALLERLGLPASLDALRARCACAFEPAALLAAMAHDKKARGGLRLVLPVALGEIARELAPPPGLLEALLAPR